MPKQMIEAIPGSVVGPYDVSIEGTGGAPGFTGRFLVALDSGAASLTDAVVSAACTAFVNSLVAASVGVASGTVSVIS